MRVNIVINNKYLLIPVKKGIETKNVSFWEEAKKIYEFEIPVNNEKAAEEELYDADFMAALPVYAWIGKEIAIEGDVPENFLKSIKQSDFVPESGCKKPLLHFTPDTGWMNDPCGLLYDKGIYHLFFQHNPFSVEWGNMSWGHATSKDLLHWEQQEEALMPDEDGTIFTGSAIINEQELFGLSKEAQLYIYTSAGSSSKWSQGKKFVQKLAWSVDGGKTLHKKGDCIMQHIVADNRDLKVYWHEENNHYFAVMYLEKNDYAIVTSKNLENWEVTQKLTLSEAWECPDLFKVPVEGGGEKWVFWTADGYYFLGDFDGSHFEHDGIRREAYHTMLPYAAQSFSGTDRVISIPWMRTNNPAKVRRGMMGMPRQFTLAVKEQEYILRLKLVDEYEAQKEKVFGSVQEERISYCQKEEAATEVVLKRTNCGKDVCDTECSVDIYGTKIVFKGDKLIIQGVAERSNGVKDAVRLGDKEKLAHENQDYRVLELKWQPEKISLLIDGEILEVTVDDGLLCDAFETCIDEKKGSIFVEGAGNMEVEIFKL